MEYIYEVHDILPKTLCDEIIKKFESDSRRRPGELQSGTINPTVKKCTDLSIEHITGWGTQSTRINHAFNKAFVDYQNYLKSNIFGEDKAYIVDNLLTGENVVRNTFVLRKYQVGDFFDWHVDYNPSITRICNFIIYLNDHEACTEFLDGKKLNLKLERLYFSPLHGSMLIVAR